MQKFLTRRLGLWILCAGFIAFLQWRTQANLRDFDGADGDEASHFVTSMMVGDYLSSGFGEPPIDFAERFYMSYPRVAFGIWPPLFHLLGGTWFAAVAPSRWSALALVAALIGLLACLLYMEASRQFGNAWAAATCATFLVLPLTVKTASYYGADPAVSLFMFAAALAWTRYLTGGQARHAVAFGLLAGIALLCKYNALALALLPVISIPLTGQWALLRRGVTWVSALIVVVVAGPWYVFSWNLVKYAAEGVEPDRIGAFQGNLKSIGAVLGMSILITAALSVARAVKGVTIGNNRIWHVSLFSFTLSVVLFHSFVYPYVQDRYFLACLPAALLLSTSGILWIIASPSGGRLPAALACASLILFLGPGHTQGGDNRHSAVRDVANYLSSLSHQQGRRVLVSAPFLAEGAVISEVAIREARPSSFLLRGSKMLAKSSWNGYHYRLLFSSEADLLRGLDEMRVGYVLLDTHASEPHNLLMRKVIANASNQWELLKTFPYRQSAAGRQFQLYRRSGPFVHLERPLAVDLSYTLGRAVKLSLP